MGLLAATSLPVRKPPVYIKNSGLHGGLKPTLPTLRRRQAAVYIHMERSGVCKPPAGQQQKPPLPAILPRIIHFLQKNPMHDENNHNPGKGLPLPQNNLPATLNTSKKLVQHLKAALAHSSRDLMAEDDGWVERLVHGLEAGINQYTVIRAVIKTANEEQELDSLPRDKAI